MNLSLARIQELREDAAAVRRAVGVALRRRSTYPGFARELLWAGVNLALYPAGLVSDALKTDQAVRLGDRYSSGLALRYLDPEAAATPIVLVHGWFHNRSAFLVMQRALRRFGYRTVVPVNYNVIGHDIPELAAQLKARVEEVLAQTEATRVHLVCHSLGGIVARYYIQMLGGDATVHSCVTLGTPHQGTYAAAFSRGRAARQLRPGSPLMRDLQRTARAMPVRFLSFYSNLDTMVLPPSHAKLTEPALRARNVLVKDLGHMSFLLSRPLVRAVAEALSTLSDEHAEIHRLRPQGPRRSRATTA